ncbi:MAG: precorrin-4 C(11)-methyltransferase [Candidatus Pacebacteria bacterium]|nr:precorrin-4 C(11)-methyltransferase [Candidatus Paceibacterota bacterium]
MTGIESPMISFIGAGPGAADLITIRGLQRLQAADLVLFAGSLVPTELVEQAKFGARVIDSAPLNLDQIMELMIDAVRAGERVARVHSGDPSLYGAIGEQIRRLVAAGIAYDIIPGVPAYAAAAAILGCELTLPEVSQTVILTRTSTRASPMPAGEELERLAATGATLAIHLAITNLAVVVRQLIPFYGVEGAVAVVYRASWPDELVLRGTLSTIREQVKKAGITRTALILVGPVLAQAVEFRDSALYDPKHFHVLRPRERI